MRRTGWQGASLADQHSAANVYQMQSQITGNKMLEHISAQTLVLDLRSGCDRKKKKKHNYCLWW